MITIVTATAGPAGPVLTVYGRGGAVALRVPLSNRQALLLASDLLALAGRQLFSLDDGASNSPADDDRSNPAGPSAGKHGAEDR